MISVNLCTDSLKEYDADEYSIIYLSDFVFHFILLLYSTQSTADVL